MREGVVEFPIFSPLTLLSSVILPLIRTYAETSVFYKISSKTEGGKNVCLPHVTQVQGLKGAVVYFNRGRVPLGQ